jgi:carbonic anhydrase
MKRAMLIGVIAQAVVLFGGLIYMFVDLLSDPVRVVKNVPDASVALAAAPPATPPKEPEPAQPVKAEPPEPVKAEPAAPEAKLEEAPTPEVATHETVAKEKDESPPQPAAEQPAGNKTASKPETDPAKLLAQTVSELMDGNERFAQGVAQSHDLLQLRKAPAPVKAVVVACSDATVPPELLFDQALGSLVVVRTPAALIDDAVIAAVDDAVARQHAKVVLVLGHRHCHPLETAASHAKAGPGEATTVAKVLAVSGGHARADIADAVVTASSAALTKRSAVLRHQGAPPVMRLVYNEGSGTVRWLDVDPAEHASR